MYWFTGLLIVFVLWKLLQRLLEGRYAKRGYLVEVRISGSARKYYSKTVRAIRRKFRIRKKVPHMTLVGPLQTDNYGKLVRTLEEVADRHRRVTYEFDGFGKFDNSNTIFLEVKPSEELLELREELVRELGKFCKMSKWDEKPYRPHITFANNLPPGKFRKMWDYVTRLRPLKGLKYRLLRLTLLSPSRKISKEYDLVLGKMLSRQEALDKNLWVKTLRNFQKQRRSRRE